MKKHLDLLNMLSSFTGLEEHNIIKTIQFYKNKYKKFYIPKKNGGVRAIFHPAQQLKMLQYALDVNVLHHLPVSNIAMAYKKNLKSPLRKIAGIHAKYAYTVRVDFKDFFPSLRPNDLVPILTSHYFISNRDIELISHILFRGTWEQSLPIGAPSSPSVSNAIMEKFDSELISLSETIDRNAAVSRYADDLFFSTNVKGACYCFFHLLSQYCRNCESPKLTINSEKVLFLSRGTKRTVCGMTLASQGWATIGRQRKIEIKKSLYQMKNGHLSEDNYTKLLGTMAFIKDVEPDFYNKLVIKYDFGI